MCFIGVTIMSFNPNYSFLCDGCTLPIKICGEKLALSLILFFFPLMMKIVIVVEELGGMDDFKTCVQSIYLLIVLGILTSFTQKLHWHKSVRWYVNLQVNVNRNISGGLWFKIHQIGRDGSFWLLPILAQGVSIFKWCMWVWIWLAVLGSNSLFFFVGEIHVIGSNKQLGVIQKLCTCRIWNLRQLQAYSPAAFKTLWQSWILNLRLSLDSVLGLASSVYVSFLWVSCTVHRTHKYGS